MKGIPLINGFITQPCLVGTVIVISIMNIYRMKCIYNNNRSHMCPLTWQFATDYRNRNILNMVTWKHKQ